MPRRSLTFFDNSYYHLFNQGIESLQLFRDSQDIQAFLDSLAYYLVEFSQRPTLILARTGLAYNAIFRDRITLYAYCLLPNSFHLLLHQTDHQAIVKFMQRVGTAYSMYFNKKYSRRGTLFEGRFRAKHIDTDDYLLESTKYIHRLQTLTTSANKPYEPQPASVASPLSVLRSTLATQSTTSTVPITSSYHRYLDHSQPNYTPTTYIDQAVKPDHPLYHLSITHPGTPYSNYVQDSPNVDWYRNLLDWLPTAASSNSLSPTTTQP